jgi:hypothetical protein
LLKEAVGRCIGRCRNTLRYLTWDQGLASAVSKDSRVETADATVR